MFDTLYIDWRAHLPQTDKSQRRYKRILNWFLDEPEREYSIHRIAKEGLALDKRIGEWFGPSTVAHVLRYFEDCPAWTGNLHARGMEIKLCLSIITLQISLDEKGCFVIVIPETHFFPCNVMQPIVLVSL